MKLAHIVFAYRSMLAVSMLAALAGCMSSSPIWDAHFGEAERSVMKAQIIDPSAAEHAQSASGIDGKPAVSAMETYQKSFEQPAPTPNAFVIGVGSGNGGGAGGQ